jgi:diguanylate cyclase (GGDEF)-like protein
MAIAAGCAVAMVAYVSLPSALAESLFQLLAWSSILVFWWSSRRTEVRLPWTLISGGLALFAVGDLWFTINDHILDNVPFPSGADIAYLAGYFFLAAGLASLVRQGGRVREHIALIDAAIIVVPVSVAAWIYVIAPVAAASSTDWLARAVSAAYPIGDLICGAILVRILSGSLAGRRTAQPALGLMVGGILTMLAGDVWFLVVDLRGEYTSGGWNDSMFIVPYVAFAAASRFRSFAAVGTPEPNPAPLPGLRRVLVLGAVSVVTPSLLVIQWLNGGDPAVPLIVAGTVLTFVLVVARMGNLVLALDSSHDRLRYEVEHDSLTGLFNRAAVLTQLRQMIHDRHPGAVLFIDLDGFKSINDRFGHSVGDEVLRQVGVEITASVRGTDVVARLGGDEFVVVMRTDDETAAFVLASRLIERLDIDAGSHDQGLGVTASIGLVRWSSDALPASAEWAIDEADHAMYEAKRNSGNQLAIVSSVLRRQQPVAPTPPRSPGPSVSPVL